VVSPVAFGEGGHALNKESMYHVYLIQSESHPDQRYIGFTRNLKERLIAHSSGKTVHTPKYRPWILVTYHAFADKLKAYEFERYLKTGSGQAFAKKQFW
jgi:predicted GIY-YIG superfamily endonuclease